MVLNLSIRFIYRFGLTFNAISKVDFCDAVIQAVDLLNDDRNLMLRCYPLRQANEPR
jgi:hypothetical protein